MLDIEYLSGAVKLVLVGYASELLFARSRPEIFAHHLLSFGLFFFGQLAFYETHGASSGAKRSGRKPDVEFAELRLYRMASWLLLQATTEQLTYFAECLCTISARISGSRTTIRRRSAPSSRFRGGRYPSLRYGIRPNVKYGDVSHIY